MWPTSKAHFLPNGRPLRTGEIFRQPDLARTLRAMAEVEKKALAAGATREAAIDKVRDYFYRGEIARKIDAFSKANGGLLRYEDMAAFKLQVEEPVSTTFKGYRVYKNGFWSQGPAMIETLNILDGFDDQPAFNSAAYIHRVVEALKLAYADRDTYYGDPKFSHIPADVLLSKEYGAERRKLITDKASQEFLPGDIHGKPGHHPSEEAMAHIPLDPVLMAHDTTCVDAIDKDGMMFSATPSGAWLPSVIAGDTGIPLSERAQSFVLIPGSPNELGSRQAAARDVESDAGDVGRWQARRGALHARWRYPGAGFAAGDVQLPHLPHERGEFDRGAALRNAPSGFEFR